MKISWTRQAVADLLEARRYIATDDPAAARRVADRLAAAAALLGRSPGIGREGRIEGTRELVVPKTRFLLPYRIGDEQLEIIHVHHARRDWPPE